MNSLQIHPDNETDPVKKHRKSIANEVKKEEMYMNLKHRQRALMLWIIGGIIVLIVIFSLPVMTSAQEVGDPFLDNSFIDDSFINSIDGGAETSNLPEGASNDEYPTLGADTNNGITGGSIGAEAENNTAPILKSFFLLKFSLDERWTYHASREKFLGESTSFNKDKRFFTPNWDNELVLNNYFSYKNKQRWLQLKADYNLYFSARDTRDTRFDTDNFADSMDTSFGYELRESVVGVSFANKAVTVSTGKIFRKYGSAYLINPSNPLSRGYATRVNFAKNTTINAFETPKVLSTTIERGSGDDIGYWASEVEFSLYPIIWRLAYLPKMHTGFAEFDRPDYTWLTNIGYNAWDTVHPTLQFLLYGDEYVAAADLSVGAGNSLTLHTEWSISSENELLILRETSNTALGQPLSAQEYSLSPYDKNGLYVSGLVGLSYTPQIENKSLFSMIFELYYNGKGLWQEDWQKQIDLRGDIETQASDFGALQTEQSLLEDSYAGLLNISRYYYSPLDARPFYVLLRVYRDDVLGAVWKESLNLETDLVYSILDTTFSWNTGIEVEMQELISIGAETRYYFGQPYGAFTELDDNFLFSIYSKIRI